MKSVVDYFQEVYGYTIKYSHLPCLQVGSQKKVNYLPMEVGYALNLIKSLLLVYSCFSIFELMWILSQACKIVGGQRYTKGLNEKQITSLLKFSCQRPREQETDILQVIIMGAWYHPTSSPFCFIFIFQSKLEIIAT